MNIVTPIVVPVVSSHGGGYVGSEFFFWFIVPILAYLLLQLILIGISVVSDNSKTEDRVFKCVALSAVILGVYLAIVTTILCLLAE